MPHLQGFVVYFTNVISDWVCPGVGGYGSQGTGTGHSHGSSNTKGAEYDQTGGQVDDRSGMQKIKDKLTPGSSVGKHTQS